MTAQTLSAIALWVLVPIAAWAAIAETINLARVHQLREDLDAWGDWTDAHIGNIHHRLEQTYQATEIPGPAADAPTVTVAIHDVPDPDPATVPTPVSPPPTVPEAQAITAAGDQWVAEQMAKIMANVEATREKR